MAPGAPNERLAGRLARLRGQMTAAGLERAVVTHLPNIRYLTNFSGTTAVVVVRLDRVALLTDSRYFTVVEQMQAGPCACPGLDVVPVVASYEEALAVHLLESPVRTAVEGASMAVERFRWLEARLGTSVPLVVTERLVEQLRVIKDGYEIECLRRAASTLDGVIERVAEVVRAGRAEREVAADLDWHLRRAGFEKPAFDTIVASGPQSALPHARPGERQLVVGDLLMLDFGGVLGGYCCDLTRTVSVGTAGPEQRRVHGAVLEAQQHAIRTVRPGILPSAVDATVREVLARHALEGHFGHGTGHGLGLEVHEEPRVGRSRPDVVERPLQPGMVFTIEPGVYIPGWGGVRIEDDVLVTTDGHEVLTRVPRDLREC